MRVDKTKILDHLESTLSADLAPIPLVRAITAAIEHLYNLDNATAAEKAEGLVEPIRTLVSARMVEAANDYFGYFYHLQISDLSPDHIHGACHAFPSDGPEAIERKKRRSRHIFIGQMIDRLDEEEFEHFCGGVLRLLGVQKPVVTPKGGDQGIDFFGRWDLRSAIKESAFPDGLEKQFSAWIIGQAKKYDKTKINTDVVRELVGSVQLAKAKVFSRDVDEYADLGIAFCDPVFYCLVTTGAVTSGVATLLKTAGMLFFDRDLLSVFVADSNDGSLFDPDNEDDFRRWANSAHEQGVAV